MESSRPTPVAAMRGGAKNVSGFVVVVLLSAVAFLPSAARFLLDASSLTAGLLGACLIIGGLGVIGTYRFESGPYWHRTLFVATAIVFVIVFHSLIASLWFPPSLGRSAGSLVSVVIVLLMAYQARTILRQTEPETLHRVLTLISFVFLPIALLSILQWQPQSATIFDKAIFPFTEPSHFALTLAPFLIYQCVTSRLPIKLVWLSGSLVLAYFLQNLSLVVAVGVTALCCLPGLWLVLALLGVAAVIESLDISYFTDRLDFSSQTTNLSTLVYIQGVELMSAALKATSGWGIGFQQLGIAPINVPTSDLIYRLSHDDANLRDGGFLAAKLVAELGLIGLLLVLCFVWVATRAVLTLRRHNDPSIRGEPLRLFALSLIAAFSVEMFVRGLGYFSGTAFLLVSALLLTAEDDFLRRNLSAECRPCPA